MEQSASASQTTQSINRTILQPDIRTTNWDARLPLGPSEIAEAINNVAKTIGLGWWDHATLIIEGIGVFIALWVIPDT